MSETIQATVEIAEPEVKVVNEIPTREDVKARGWSKDEIDSAEKRGMIAKAKKEEEKEPLAVKAEEKSVSGKTGKEVVTFGYIGAKVWATKAALMVKITLA